MGEVLDQLKKLNGTAGVVKGVAITAAVTVVGAVIKHVVDNRELDATATQTLQTYRDSGEANKIEKYNAYLRMGGRNKKETQTNIYNNKELDKKINQNSTVRSNRKRLGFMLDNKKKLEANIEANRQMRQKQANDAAWAEAKKQGKKKTEVVAPEITDNVTNYDYLKELPSYSISTTNGLFNWHKGLRAKIKANNETIRQHVVDSQAVKIHYEDANKAQVVMAPAAQEHGEAEANAEQQNVAENVVLEEQELTDEQQKLEHAEKFDNSKFQIEKGSLEYNILVGGMDAVEMSRKIKDETVQNHWFKKMFWFTKAGKAISRHNEIKKKVKRNQALYQKTSLKAFEEMYDMLSSKKNLDCQSDAVINKYMDIMLRDAKSSSKRIKKAGDIDKTWLYFDPETIKVKKMKEGNGQYSPLANYEAAKEIYISLRQVMSMPDGVEKTKSIKACIDDYGKNFTSNLFQSNQPMCHKYFSSQRNRRIMKLMPPNYAAMLLMQCLTQKLFDAVNRYSDGSTDIAAFGKLAANYQVTKLAASAVMHRNDFESEYDKAKKQSDANDKVCLNAGVEVMKEKFLGVLEDRMNGEENAQKREAKEARAKELVSYLDFLKDEAAEKNELTEDFRRYIIEYGAMRNITTSTKEPKKEFQENGINELYEAFLKQAVAESDSRESLIADYADRLFESKKLPKAPALKRKICKQIRDNMGKDFLFANFWDSLIQSKITVKPKSANVQQIQENRKNQNLNDDIKETKAYFEQLDKQIGQYYKNDLALDKVLKNLNDNKLALRTALNTALTEEKNGRDLTITESMVNKLCLDDNNVITLMEKTDSKEVQDFIYKYATNLERNIQAINASIATNDYTAEKAKIKEEILNELGVGILTASERNCAMLVTLAVRREHKQANANSKQKKEEKRAREAVKDLSPELQVGVLGRLAEECNENPDFMSQQKDLKGLLEKWAKNYTSNLTKYAAMCEQKQYFFDANSLAAEVKFIKHAAWTDPDKFEIDINAHIQQAIHDHRIIEGGDGEGLIGGKDINKALAGEGDYQVHTENNDVYFENEFMNNKEFKELLADDVPVETIIEAVKENPQMKKALEHVKRKEDLNNLNASDFNDFCDLVKDRLTVLAKAYNKDMNETERVRCIKELLKKDAKAMELTDVETLVKDAVAASMTTEEIKKARQALRFSGRLTENADIISFDTAGKDAVDASVNIPRRLKHIKTADRFWASIKVSENAAELEQAMLQTLNILNAAQKQKFTRTKSNGHVATSVYHVDELTNAFIRAAYNYDEKEKQFQFDNKELTNVWNTISSGGAKTDLMDALAKHIKNFVGEEKNLDEFADSSAELALMGKGAEILSKGKPGYKIFKSSEGEYREGLSELMAANVNSRTTVRMAAPTQKKDETKEAFEARMKEYEQQVKEYEKYEGNVFAANANAVDTEWSGFVDEINLLCEANEKIINYIDEHLKNNQKTQQTLAKAQLEEARTTLKGLNIAVLGSLDKFKVDESSAFDMNADESVRKDVAQKLHQDQAILFDIGKKKDNVEALRQVVLSEATFASAVDKAISIIQNTADSNFKNSFKLPAEYLEFIRNAVGEVSNEGGEIKLIENENVRNFKNRLRTYQVDKDASFDKLEQDQGGRNFVEIMDNIKKYNQEGGDKKYAEEICKNYDANMQMIEAEESKLDLPAGQRLKPYMVLFEKDNKFIQLMSSPQSGALKDYVLELRTKYKPLMDFFTDEKDTEAFSQYEDMMKGYITFDMDTLLKMDEHLTKEDIKQRFDHYNDLLTQVKGVNGKSFRDIMKRDRVKKSDQEKFMVVSALATDGLYSLTDLYLDPDRMEEIIERHLYYKKKNEEYLKKNYEATLRAQLVAGAKNISAWEIFQRQYGIKLVTMLPEEFKENVKDMVEEAQHTTVGLEKNIPVVKVDTIHETNVRNDIAKQMDKGNRAFSEDEKTIAQQARYFYSGVSPVEVAYRKKNAKPYTQKEFLKACKTVENAIYSSDEFAKDMEVAPADIKLLAELNISKAIYNKSIFWDGNIDVAYKIIRDIRAQMVTAFDQYLEEHGMKELANPDAQTQTLKAGLLQQEVDRYLYYQAAQGRLHFDTNEPAKNRVQRICQQIANFVIRNLGGKIIDNAPKDAGIGAEEQYDGYRVSQQALDSMLEEKLDIADEGLKQQIEDETVGLQMAMFTMPAEAYITLVNNRKHYYRMANHVLTCTKAVALKELVDRAGGKFDNTKELDNYATQISRNMVIVLGDEMKELMPDNKNKKKINTEAYWKDCFAKLDTMISDKLTGKDKNLWIGSMIDSTKRTAITKETIEKDSKVTKDVGYEGFEQAIKKLGREYVNKFNALTMSERQALALALGMPGHYVSTDGGYSEGLITRHMLVRDSGEVVRDVDKRQEKLSADAEKLIKILMTEERMDGITYSAAVHRLNNAAGKSISREAFNQALDFIKTAKSEATQVTKKRWDVINDPTKSIEAVQNAQKPIAQTKEVLDTNDFLAEVKKHLTKEMQAKLDDCKNIPLLITLLQNRSLLDTTGSKEKNEDKVVNPYMRREVIKQWVTDENKRNQYIASAEQSVFLNKALDTLKSYKVKETVDPNRTFLTVNDLDQESLNRTTELDETLLMRALAAVESVQKSFNLGVNTNEQVFNNIYGRNVAMNGGIHKTILFDNRAFGLISERMNAMMEDSYRFDVYTTNGEYAEWMRKAGRDAEVKEALKNEKALDQLLQEAKKDTEEAQKRVEEEKQAEKAQELQNENDIKTDVIEAVNGQKENNN